MIAVQANNDCYCNALQRTAITVNIVLPSGRPSNPNDSNISEQQTCNIEKLQGVVHT